MKNTTSLRSIRGVVAAATASMVLALPFQAAAWSTPNNGFYGGDAISGQIRVGPLPGQSSGSFPQSAEVFRRTFDLLRSVPGLRLNTTWTGNSANIGLSGVISGIRISGTVRVRTADPVVSGNSAFIYSTVSATGTVEDTIINEAINVTEIVTLQPDGNLAYSSFSPSSESGGEFFQPETTLGRVTLGIGTESSPFIPPNANWTAVFIIVIMPVLPNRPTNFDPPYAKGFDYKIASGRTERVEKVFAPKGFGKKIKVFASSSRGGRPKLVGTVASGKSINLTKAKGLKGGAAFVRMQGMKPKPDLSKDFPYPIGFTFTNLSEGSAKVEVIPKKG